MKPQFIKAMCLVASMSLVLSGCGSKKNAAYDDAGADYATISSVDGIIFNVPQAFTSKATAVTRIANDQEFTNDGIYSYTNGNDEYMFFCMDELIILANKGTSFNFSETADKESALSTSSVIDSMCSKLGKKLNYTESDADGVYKLVADVSENVAITTELYGDYIGKLAVIEDGTDEWSVLAGVKGTSLSDIPKEQLKVIDTVVGSMKATHGDYAIQDNTPDYDVIIDEAKGENTQNVSVEIPKEDEGPKEEASETSEEVKEEPTEVTEPPKTEDEVIFEEESESEPSNEQTEVPEEAEEQPAKEPAKEPESEEPKEEDTGEKVRSNQRERDLSEAKVYDSDVYSLLNIGNYGLMVSADTEGEIQYPVVHLKNVYTGQDAVDMVKKQASHTTRYDYFEAPLGYSWQVAEYDIIYTGEKQEVDVRMLGVDGNTLKYRGVPAPQRTYYMDYDITELEETGTLQNIKVFYAVPNGCKEYVLKFGDGKVGTETEHYSAYYHVLGGR